MANSQVKCLEDDLEFINISEASPQFYYSETQRTALEALLSSGEAAFNSYLKNEGARQFLSREEIISLESTAVDSQLGKLEYEEDSELDEDLTVSYWPGKSDVPTPMLDLGWPEGDTWKGITRADVYTHPPTNNAPHIKVVVRRTIQNATKVIAVVMDIFTDPDIFLDMYEAATRRMVPVYIILSLGHLSSFIHMLETTGINVRFTENIRVRVISGCTFSSRKLKQVTGVLKEKFLLVDCNTVITGTYSFTWSDSRLNRNLITLLTGEITDSFDNQFRTLFAASEPLQRYDFVKDPNKDSQNRVIIPSPAPALPKDTENVNSTAQAVPVVPEPHTNGFSSPQRFTTHGALQPTDVISSPYLIPMGGLQLSKSINNIAARRTVVPAIVKNNGMDAGFNRTSGVPQDSSAAAKSAVNVPDYSIRHRLAACHNFEGPSMNFRNAQESHSALSDILKNVQRNRLSVAKTTGGRPSKSLWDLSQLSQLSGCSGEPGLRQNPLELGEDTKSKSRWSIKDTPAMLLMRQRAFPEENRPRETNLVSFQSLNNLTPVRLQGQLVHGVSTTSLARPWTSTTRQLGRPTYY
ncbi:protein FAM83E [Bufo gargarizans]|uniref:protein FAM83E n=1 Tax=Bufo gargarizans TaxID=30331 RepID=UPI001CF54F80|nr:protein FAM83E [Bufo gargarizans]